MRAVRTAMNRSDWMQMRQMPRPQPDVMQQCDGDSATSEITNQYPSSRNHSQLLALAHSSP